MDLSRKRYQISVANFIRDKLAGYRGGSAIAGEMIQNADDARATSIEFVFSDSGLTVRNDSYFTEQDFDNVLEIASGGKRDETGKTGTWGTGFISVFHLTDRPELRSNGWHVVFDISGNIPPVPCDIGQTTEFWLPWRRDHTEVAQKIDAGPWTDEAIEQLRADIVRDAYQLLLFLRHVTEIVVKQIDAAGQEQQLCKVTRRLEASQFLPNSRYSREHWSITRQVAEQASTTDGWLYYRRTIDVPVTVRTANVTVKDQEIAVAFPLIMRDWMREHLRSLLYNFLPTPIETGYPFQLNGAFFPDNNRREIWLSSLAHEAWRDWNRHVLNGLAELVSDCLLDVRDLVESPRRFCELLPTVQSTIGYLEPIHKQFVDRAPQLPIAYSSLNTWLKPGEVYLGQPGSKLPTLVQAYLPVLATGLTQEYRTFLRDHCNMPALTWRPVFELLSRHTKTLHPLLADRETLEALCQELPRILANEDIAALAKVAFVPGEDGQLHRPADLWHVADDLRPFVTAFDQPFVEAAFQQRFAQLVSQICVEFDSNRALEFLGKEVGDFNGIEFGALAPFFTDENNWTAFLSYLGEHRAGLKSKLLQTLPIVRATDGLYYRPDDTIYFHDNRRESKELARLGLRFVHPDHAQRGSAVALLYSHAGVRSLHPRDVIRRLQNDRSARPIEADALLELYSYFTRSQLEESDKYSLRALPLVMTQGGRLVASGEQTLHLPPTQAIAGSIDTILDKLNLDNLIHSRLAADGSKFLRDVLGLTHLDSQQLIDSVIVPNYAADCFNDDERLRLLAYVRRYLSDYGSEDAKVRALWDALRQTPVILCEDGAYRRAAEITLRSPVSDEVLGSYPAPHEQYDFAVSGEGESKWQWFFKGLGINLHPTPLAVVLTVKKIVSGGTPADDERMARIRTIYGWLNSQSRLDEKYRSLAEFAWLPAQEDNARWYKPSEIQRASNKNLVGEQAKLLALGEPGKDLRELLAIPLWPNVETVVKHLLASASANVPIDGLVYQRLANNITTGQLETLRRTPSIYDNKRERYWLPGHVFFTDQSQFFGARRGYLRQTSDESVNRLWESLGVRQQPTEQDLIAVALEITGGEYPDNRPTNEDVDLLYALFAALGKRLAADGEHSLLIWQLNGVLIPDDSGRLCRPQRIVIPEPPKLLEQFDKKRLPCVDMQRMTPEIRLLWQRLGLAVLRDVVQQVPHHTGDTWRDDQFSRKLQQLSSAFERIARTVNRTPSINYRSPAAVLAKIAVKRCNALRAFYRLEGDDGWKVDGHIRDVKAVYDPPSNSLFLQDGETSAMRLELALALDELLFPEAKKVEAIEQLLDMEVTLVDRYLDERGYDSASRASEPAARGTRQAEIADYSDQLDPAQKFDEEPAPPLRPAPVAPPAPAPAKQPPLDLPQPNGREPQKVAPPASAPPASAPPMPAPPPPTPAEPLPPAAQATDDEPIPAFNGRVLIETPRRPNDYRALKRKYGLEFEPEPEDDTYIADAVPVSGDAWPSKEPAATNVKTARIILRFSARENGYLPLTGQASLLFSDKPTRLRCATNYPEWEFELYGDYEDCVLYNQTELPAFFDEHNIPAGGIVYLERTSESNVRLFWKPLPATVEKLRLLFLDENGQLHEEEVDAADYPCEVHEYVLRSDKRLEDIDALFDQARDKDGIFQIMCDMFGAANRVLDFDAIFDGVMTQRLVSHVSIRYQLNERDCFVSLGDDRWRFEPARGGNRRKATPRQTGAQQPPPQIPAPAQQEAAPTVGTAPFLTDVADGLQRVLRRWQQDTMSVESRLRQLIEDLKRLLLKLETALAELTRKANKTDEQLAQRWRQVAEGVDTEGDAAFLRYLDTRGELSATLDQLRSLLVATPADDCKQVYVPLLLRWAEAKVAIDARDAARAIYELLHRCGYNVQHQLAELDAWRDVEESIELVQMARTFDERWEYWRLAWEKHRNNPRVRQLIADDLAREAAALNLELDSGIGKISSAVLGKRVYGWLRAVMPTVEAWGAMAAADGVWKIGARAFNALTKQGDDMSMTLALQVVSLIPSTQYSQFQTDKLLNAAISVASGLDSSVRSDEAAYLVGYMLFVTRRDTQRLPDSTTLFQAYKQYAEYCEKISLHPIAYRALHEAKKHTIRSSEKQEIGNLQYKLRDKCGEIDLRQPLDAGFPKEMALSDRLSPLINPALRAEWIAAA